MPAGAVDVQTTQNITKCSNDRCSNLSIGNRRCIETPPWADEGPGSSGLKVVHPVTLPPYSRPTPTDLIEQLALSRSAPTPLETHLSEGVELSGSAASPTVFRDHLPALGSPLLDFFFYDLSFERRGVSSKSPTSVPHPRFSEVLLLLRNIIFVIFALL